MSDPLGDGHKAVSRFTLTISFTLTKGEADLLSLRFQENARQAAKLIDLDNPDQPCTITWDTRPLTHERARK